MRTPFGGSSPRSLPPVLWAALVLATGPARAADGPAAFAVPKEVRAVLDAHCVDCHADRGKGNVDVTALGKLKLSDRLETLNKIEDQLLYKMMPPARAAQPGADELRAPAAWVSTDKGVQARLQLGRAAREFAARREGKRAESAPGGEREKVPGYADSLEAVDRMVDAMADAIRPHVPKLDARYLADEMTTVDRQRGHVEVLAALVSGLTNVVAFTVDELGHEYTGLPGVEAEKVNLHDVGHGKGVGKLTADEVRFAVRRQHMTLVDTIAARLKKVPEGGGTMFDNTMIFYFPDNGETHHSQGTEYPFVVLSGKNAKLHIRGRYVRLPNYGEQGHKTLGNWYTTLLNAHGNPVKHYGDPDPGLARFGLDQTGAIKQFLG